MNFKRIFKILTLLVLTVLVFSAQASIVVEQQAENYLRWNLFVAKDIVQIERQGRNVTIRTLERELFDRLKEYFQNIKTDRRYILAVNIEEINQSNNVATIRVVLAADEVELFHFYRQKENKLVMDFWRDNDQVGNQTAAVKKDQPKNKKIKITRPKKKVVQKRKVEKAPDLKKEKKVAVISDVAKESKYRDFRYGAPFIWDYNAISPKLKVVLDLTSKTPEFFYPIKDREYKKSDKEAHLQTTINMYRAKKWGRMYQSIQLFAKKYGDEEEIDLNEYIKANALLRINFKKPDRTTKKQAVNIFENIANRTSNYELKRGVLKYLINYYIDAGEYVKSYQLAKTYYVETKDQFDIEETEYAAEVILHNLAQMNQTSVINKLLEEKTIRKLVPSQLMYAYKIYSLVNANQIKDAVRFYNGIKKELKNPILPSITFNIGECYFRLAQFDSAIQYFDGFVSRYSFMTSAERARMRIALSYEILEKDTEKTVELYRNAINRSQSDDVQYEAKVRYVALRSVRKRELSEEDREVRVFLERDESASEELSHNLKKILWITRLRTYVVDNKFSEALAYLNAVPLNTLKPSERRVFESDGAEIVYGILKENYAQENYSNVIQAWEIYKSKYVNKVASDPLLNYLVGRSYVKLGLYNGFDKQVERFEKIKSTPLRTFPIWNKREVSRTPESLLVELRIAKDIRLGNWEHVKTLSDRLEGMNSNLNKIYFYKGLVADNSKKYELVVKNFEHFLANSSGASLDDPHDISMMMQAYTNALYELGMVDKFQKVAKALLGDVERASSKNKYMFKVRERVAYLLIETVAGSGQNGSSLEMEPLIEKFKNDFPKSAYMGRINYLLGVALVENKKTQEGIKVLEALLNDNSVSDHIKEIVRSELTLIKIKNKVI